MIDMKKQKWAAITDSMNKKFSTERTSASVQEKWRSLKKKAKKESAKQRAEIFKTGGGINEHKTVSQDNLEILDMIRPQIEPLKNKFDSDRLADQDSSISLQSIDEKPAKKKIKPSAKIDLSEKIYELRLKEHQIRLQHMSEEHALKMRFLQEEHNARMLLISPQASPQNLSQNVTSRFPDQLDNIPQSSMSQNNFCSYEFCP